MLNNGWMALMIIGILLPASGFADDTQSSGTDGEPLPAANLSIDTLLAESGYASRWQLANPVEPLAYSNDWPRPIANISNIDFQDGSTLARMSKLRSLSLLTLAETRQTRLFLGVNEDGLVGLHFSAFARHSDERYLEMARMPYLKDQEADSEVERPGPGSK